MKTLKTAALFFALLTACTTVNVGPSGQEAEKTASPAPDPSQESVQGDSGGQTTSSGGPSDSGGSNPGPDGGGSPDSGGAVAPDAGGGGGGAPDAGGGGAPDANGGAPDAGGGGGGGGVVTSNTQNWANWNSTTSCPPWNPAPYSWKAPRTTGVGSMKCNAEAGSFYDAYLGPSASPAAQASWDNSFAACKACIFSNWSDSSWGPVVRTPNGHLVLNQGGCYDLVDSTQVSCAYSSWNFQQCGVEACDNSASQSAYQTCVATSGASQGGACGNASYGKGMADAAMFQSGSPAWSACYATGFADNERQTAIRVILSFCY